MDARLRYGLLGVAIIMSLGASHRSKNFLVTAGSASLAKEVCLAAEQFRQKMALEWLGHELPNWTQPCPIRVHASPQLGAGGVTSFVFSNGQPGQWQMTIQGSRQRILDSVLPHEITHTVFATHFGRPLPRWADEGACTTVEHASERAKQDQYLIRFLKTGRALPFNRMYHLKDYPHDILPLYSQGYSLARFLLAQGGKQHFMRYLGSGMRSKNWHEATREYYGYQDLSQLQLSWVDWVAKGSRLPAARSSGAALVASKSSTTRPASTPARDGWQPRTGAMDWQRIASTRAGAAEAATRQTQSLTTPVSTGQRTAAGGSWYRRQSAGSEATRLSRPQQLTATATGSPSGLPAPPSWSQIPRVEIPASGATEPAIVVPAERIRISGPLPFMR